MDFDKVFWAALRNVPELGNMQMRRLMDYFSTGESVWQSSKKELYLSKCLDRSAYESFIACRNGKYPDVHALLKAWEQKGIAICTIRDDNYPDILKTIYNPPALLFHCGSLRPKTHRVAIVGSRKFSPYGHSVAETLAEDLARRGVTVVSGAAKGIDTAAHRGALKSGRTAAVLGCGIDVAYPSENRRLLESIAERGAVVSEYAPGTPPLPAFFPARNRIISGLSWGTVVVEAAEKSGSLITAEMALSEGRDVFAVPGSVYSKQSEGCHQLIKQGAKLVMNAADILEEYDWDSNKRPVPEKNKLALSKEEAAVYEVLSFDKALSVDEIIYKLRSDVSNIAFILLQMELRGVVKEFTPHCYVRAVKEGTL